MITLKIYLRSYKPEAIDGIVWISFYIDRKKVNFSTDIKTLKKNWNEKKSCIATTDKDHKDKNLIIETICSRINNVFVKYRLKDRKLTREAFKRAYNRPDDFDTIFDFIKAYSSRLNFKNELSTMQTHKKVILKLKQFNPLLHFDDITKEWLDEYYLNLIKEHKNCQNTAYKDMSTLRKYVNAAFKAGYMDENPFADWAIKRTTSNYSYLTEEELKRVITVYKKGHLNPNHYRTLEFFLFMCFSSLHVSDALSLTLEQFNKDTFIYYRIKNKNKKPEPILVPVSDSLRQIIVNIVGNRKQGKIFEKLPAEQTMNGYLKEIMKMENVKIAKNISHKSGRHTFATYYLAKSKDLSSLKEILGHSDVRETLIYAHVLEESKQEGIKNFNTFEL
ncbi:MAG: site-specific integrase [Bacteroidales bacterium]|nr:site-specific integrase [Bacteroidales bacterium]